MAFAVSLDDGMKIKESEKKDKYLDVAWGQKKAVEDEEDGDTNCNWHVWNASQKLEKGGRKSWKL